MTDKHTPGPWIAKRGSVRIAATPDDGVAECWRHVDGGTLCPTLEEACANARLIAAAPDMLTALQCIALHAPSLDVIGIRELCDAAIAKATGGAASWPEDKIFGSSGDPACPTEKV